MQVRTVLAALAALLLLLAVVPQEPRSEHDLAAGDGQDHASPAIAVDRDGPRNETEARPDDHVGPPDAATPVTDHDDEAEDTEDTEHREDGASGTDGAGSGAEVEDDHVATRGEPQAVYRYDVEFRGEVITGTDDFSETTARILTDARGWTLGGSVAFQRSGDDPDFTVVLASPDEIDAAHEVCSRDYSCRIDHEILINDRNWREATAAWREVGGDLVTYRRYLLNHEVGHFLGFGHVDCGEDGERAPVMQQQSVSTQECEPNGWPLEWEREELAQQLDVTVTG